MTEMNYALSKPDKWPQMAVKVVGNMCFKWRIICSMDGTLSEFEHQVTQCHCFHEEQQQKQVT